jgi:hypothetical protein
MLTYQKIRTQKAKGIKALADTTQYSRNLLSLQAVRDAAVWPHDGVPSFPVFARPCPLTPRHGFVDSRLVNNKAEWDALVTEVKAAEKDAEIICMPYLEAVWSGILTPAGLAVGPGNDGATAGHDALAIPAVSKDRHTFGRLFNLDYNAASIKDTPYVELVATKQRLESVQLRDGPSVALTDRYVPDQMVVKSVVKAGGDLLAWERKAKEFAPGTVVWHPGGVLSSHYSVHCIINKVPVVCTEKSPKIGEALAAAAMPEMTREDAQKIARYIVAYDKLAGESLLIDSTRTQAAWLAVATLHAQGQWGNDDHLLRLRGAGAAIIVRMCAAAVLGELRHWDTNGPGRKAGVKMLTKTVGDVKLKGILGRDEVYETVFALPHNAVCSMLVTASKDFRTPGWGSSFGGAAWSKCSTITLRLTRSLAHFVANATPENWALFVKQWNNAVHVAHNGGLFLNKFMDESYMSSAALCPTVGLANPILGRVLFANKPEAPSLRHTRKIGRLWRSSAKASNAGIVVGDDLLPVPKREPEPPVEYTTAQCKISGTVLHVQVKCDPKNRDYGWAFSAPLVGLTPKDKSKLVTLALTQSSYNPGSPTQYGPCTVSVVDGVTKIIANGVTITMGE